MICFDENGPLELRPFPGEGLARRAHPQRLRAHYRRTAGTEQFLGFYDVHADCLEGQTRRRKTHRDLLAAFRRLRACYPAPQRLYVIMDNLNTHRHPLLLRFFRRHRITSVPTPTYASWLNAIEAHFGPLRKFCLRGSDDPSHLHRRRRIARYLTWRNRQHQAKHSPLSNYRRIKLEEH